MHEAYHNLDRIMTFESILPCIVDKNCIFADNAAMLLSNLTRSEQGCELCLKSIEKSQQYSLKNIFDVLCNEKYNEHVELHHVAIFLSNLSRLKVVRMLVLDKAVGLMQKLLPYVSFQKSVMRRKGIVGIIRNCCFEYGMYNHNHLEVDIQTTQKVFAPALDYLLYQFSETF